MTLGCTGERDSSFWGTSRRRFGPRKFWGRSNRMSPHSWDAVPQEVKVVRQEHLPGLDSQPICVQIVSYTPPCAQNVWANAEYLEVTNQTLDEFKARVCTPAVKLSTVPALLSAVMLLLRALFLDWSTVYLSTQKWNILLWFNPITLLPFPLDMACQRSVSAWRVCSADLAYFLAFKST